MSMKYARLMAIAIATLILTCSARAINNGAEVPCNDRRFDAVGVFFNASNGSACGGWVAGSCVLIGPSTVLCARHCLEISPHDPLPDLSVKTFRVRFRRDANGQAYNALQINGDTCHGTYQEFTVTSFIDAPIPGSDLVLAELSGSPIGIHPIPVEVDSPPVTAREIIICGWGYSGPCLGSGTPWIIRSAKGMMVTQGLTDYMVYSPCVVTSGLLCTTCPPGGPFVSGNLHDSGGGVFIEEPSDAPGLPGQLRLIATIVSTNGAKRPSAWNHAGGAPQLEQGAWVSSSTATADFDADGQIVMGDMFSFLGAYFRESCMADLDANGEVGPTDLFAYVGAYLARH